jgi:predicted secreted protein
VRARGVRTMGIAGSLMVIAIGWWLAFFVMLPVGVKSQIEDGTVVPGSEPSAPTTPRLWPKALWALVIALCVWAFLFWLIELSGVSINDVPVPSGLRWN